ncbi:RNA directed DNA polymerase reverse transcriptase [Echinococcus multilocularis]|uniref:RNA directed DNA polymerase reverse transcriptase n=1 Tax=Echinococcus multilocularis TaxID=6211 RepID=A0A068XU94_ECHMU|nr:RNA directed DNA polymerase reverse transcriptase [Echinococcus multilocularis]
MDFEEWLLTAKFNLLLYPRCQRIPLILRALPHDLFVAAVGASITHDTDVDQCCDTLAQLVTDCEKQTLARDFFQRFQKADETDEEVKILSPSTKLRSAEGREMLVDGETLLKVGIGKETWTVKFIACPELAWDVILGADFLRYTKAILNFAEGTFSTHEATRANTDTPSPKDDSDDICNALFEAAAILMNNLDDLCAQLTHISNYERKELRQLLLKYANIFSWQEWSKLSLEDEILWYQEGERVGIDIMGPLPPPTKRGNRYILVTVEYFTKAAEAEPMKSHDAETVASVFFNRWICQNGVPESVHSDQGPNFEIRLFIGLCKVCWILKTRTTPAHPQGNGQVERTNRTLIGLLKTFTKDVQPDDWDLSLGRVLLAYRATVQTSTGVSPFKMLRGREMRVLSDIFVPNTDGSADNVPELILRLKESIRRTFDSAHKHLRLSYTRQKKYYVRHCRTNVCREGDLVQIYRPVPPPGTHCKFHHPWSKDPFRVVKALSLTNYLVPYAQLRTQPITIHHYKLRPYKGPLPVGYEDEVYVLTKDRT